MPPLPPPRARAAAKRSAPSASKTPACSATSTGDVAEAGDAGGDRPDERPVADEHDGAVDLALVVEAVDVARHAVEEAAEDAPVRLALVGEVGELALGEHGAAAGHGDAVGARLGQGDGLVERAAEPRAQAFDGLAGAGRAALVGLVAHAPLRVAREHRVAAAADADDVERAVRVQPGGGLLLGDLLGQAADDGLAEAVAVDARRGDAGQASGVELAVQLEERAQRIAEMALRARLQHVDVALTVEFAHGEGGRDLAEVDADRERSRRRGDRAGPFGGRARAGTYGGVVHASAYTRAWRAATMHPTGARSAAATVRAVVLSAPQPAIPDPLHAVALVEPAGAAHAGVAERSRQEHDEVVVGRGEPRFHGGVERRGRAFRGARAPHVSVVHHQVATAEGARAAVVDQPAGHLWLLPGRRIVAEDDTPVRAAAGHSHGRGPPGGDLA